MPKEAFMDTLVESGSCDVDLIPPLMNVNKAALSKMYDNGLLGPKARDFVEQQRTAVIIDNLNKTYVAFTRPRSELHLFCDTGSTGNDVKDLLLDFVADEDNTNVLTAIIGADGEPTGWFERGVMSSREELDSKRKEQPAKAIQCPITAYRVSDSSGLNLNVRVDRASSSSIDAGIRLHSVMSGIHDRNDAQRVIATALKHGVITADADDPCGIANVNAHVLGPMIDPASPVYEWFDPANVIYSERTITTVSDSLWDEDGILNLRPDRIIRRPDGQMVVIDYKSGSRDDKRYLRQLNRYLPKLRAIFPDTRITGHIWYITHDLIIPAP